jgi:Type IX secretion system protein PorV
MKRFLTGASVTAVLGLAWTAPASGQTAQDNTAYGTTAAEFLLLGAGARGAALGGAYSALANDMEALYWNPAGLALMERPGVTIGTYSYLAETRYSWGGLAFPMSGGARAVGISAGTFGFGDQAVYTVENPEGDGSTYSVRETFVGLTYAQNFSDRFSAGITGKIISDQLGRTSASAFAVDFGTSFHAMLGARPIRASFVISNLGSSLQHDGAGLDVAVARTQPLGQDNLPQEGQPSRLRTKDFGLPILFRVGLAFDFVNSSASRVTVLGEFNQPNNTNAGAGGGLEWALTDVGSTGFSVMARGSYSYQPDNNIVPVAADAGFDTDLSGKENLDGLALGGGIGYRARSGLGLTVDYAYRHMGVLGGTNFFSATINW